MTSKLMNNPDFSHPWHFSDVVLSVEGTRFHVHRSTLSMWSPVFEKMFTSEFAEKDAEEIALPGKKAKEVEVLLKIVYSHGRAQKVTGRSLTHPPSRFLQSKHSNFPTNREQTGANKTNSDLTYARLARPL